MPCGLISVFLKGQEIVLFGITNTGCEVRAAYAKEVDTKRHSRYHKGRVWTTCIVQSRRPSRLLGDGSLYHVAVPHQMGAFITGLLLQVNVMVLPERLDLSGREFLRLVMTMFER